MNRQFEIEWKGGRYPSRKGRDKIEARNAFEAVVQWQDDNRGASKKIERIRDVNQKHE